VAKSLDPLAFVTDWWPVPQPTVADDPAAWLLRIQSHLPGFAASFARALAGPMTLLLVLAAALVASLRAFAGLGESQPPQAEARGPGRRVVGLFTAIMLALLLPQLVAGYFDTRYFTALLWCGYLLVAGGVVMSGRTQHQRQVFAWLVFIVVFCGVTASWTLTLAQSALAGRTDFSQWAQFDNPDQLSTLRTCMADDPTARILVIGDNNLAARAGAQTGLRTMMEPLNMADGRLGRDAARAFIAAWNVDYVLAANPEQSGFAASIFDLTPVPGCPLLLSRVRP